jgi:hypothetical protein
MSYSEGVISTVEIQRLSRPIVKSSFLLVRKPRSRHYSVGFVSNKTHGMIIGNNNHCSSNDRVLFLNDSIPATFLINRKETADIKKRCLFATYFTRAIRLHLIYWSFIQKSQAMKNSPPTEESVKRNRSKRHPCHESYTRVTMAQLETAPLSIVFTEFRRPLFSIESCLVGETF